MIEAMKQPEALRLADSLDNHAESHNCNEEAAAELRRLHTANQELFEAFTNKIERRTLERAAVVCEARATTDDNDATIVRHECAAAIRALKDQS